jgi:hypothetical protein
VQQHVKVLAVLHIVLGGLGVLAAIIVMMVFGGIAAVLGISEQSAGAADLASPWIGILGAVIMVVVLVISLPGLIAGIGLLTFQPWARILTIVLSALELPGFPIHTALGIYGLWVLLSNEGAALFSRPTPARA